MLCRRSHTVLFLGTFLRRWVLAQLPRFLLTCLFRLLHAVLCYTIHPHNYRSRNSFLDVFSRTVLLIVSARHRHKAILVVSHRLHFLTLLRLALSAVPVLTVTVTSALWPHVSCCSHHRVLNSMPRLQVSLLTPTWCTSHGIPVKAAPLRPRLRSAISVTPPQPPACTVRIAVFSSAIVIDVIVHYHTAGPFESNGRKQLSLSSCGWVLIRSCHFKITLVAELGIQPIVTCVLDRDVGHGV